MDLVSWMALIIVILVIISYKLFNKNKELRFSKQSLSTKYGKMSEQFMPFLKDYPYNPQDFRFLGSPIDGVQFTENKVVFTEFKTSNAKLTEKQENIKRLVNQGKVEWMEFRI